jgi:hypothetical protein
MYLHKNGRFNQSLAHIGLAVQTESGAKKHLTVIAFAKAEQVLKEKTK